MMMRFKIYNLLFLTVVLIGCRVQQLDSNQEQIAKSTWQTKKIEEGALWKYQHFDDLFDSKQSITILDIDLNKKNIAVKIPYLDAELEKTSMLAEQEKAFAAINGSFFDTKSGGSVVYFYNEGQLINQTNNSIPENLDNAGFALDSRGSVSIIKKPNEGWQSLANPFTVLSSGPLLLYEGKLVEQDLNKFNDNRHPRTAIGITDNNHLIAVVVDGRSSQAYGMSIAELATMMQALGCSEAMNLDGGGSSTAWVHGQSHNGVVNYPSDNKQFDHEGERKVANAIVFVLEE